VEPENAIADSEDAIAKLADSDWENGRTGEGEIDRNEDSATRKGETGRSKRSGDSAQRKWKIKRLRD